MPSSLSEQIISVKVHENKKPDLTKNVKSGYLNLSVFARRKILGRLYRCMITKIISNAAAQIEVIMNTHKLPHHIVQIIGTKLSTTFVSCTSSD